MSSEERVSLKIDIGDRSYPLRVAVEEEEGVLRASGWINEKIMQYRDRYSDKDMQDFISMTALQLAKKQLEWEDRVDDEVILEDLRQLDSKLNRILRNDSL